MLALSISLRLTATLLLLIFVYIKFVDKKFLPNRYNVSLDKSFACIIHHSRDCETDELIFSLASKQIEICVPYLSWVWGFPAFTLLFVLSLHFLSLFFSFALCFWACECYVLSSMCRGIVYIGERKTEWAPETQCKTKIEIPNKRQQHSHIKWMCWRDNDCRPRSQYVSHAILFSFSRSALSLFHLFFIYVQAMYSFWCLFLLLG